MENTTVNPTLTDVAYELFDAFHAASLVELNNKMFTAFVCSEYFTAMSGPDRSSACSAVALLNQALIQMESIVKKTANKY